MEPEIPDFDDLDAPLPVNWQLRFLHNQFFKKFIFPSRFCPGAFHSTILRKAEFRSEEVRNRLIASGVGDASAPERYWSFLNDLSLFDLFPFILLQHKRQYFAKCNAAIAEWRKAGPQPLNTIPRTLTGEPAAEEESTLEVVTEVQPVASKKSDVSYPEDEAAEEKKNDDEAYYVTTDTNAPSAEMALQRGDIVTTAYGTGEVLSTVSVEAMDSVEVKLPYGRLFVRLTETIRKVENSSSREMTEPLTVQTVNKVPSKKCHSGIWLFTDRENISHFFKPNFLPPYDTPDKKKIILDVLREEWDEKTLSWKPCGQGSMTKSKTGVGSAIGLHLNQLDQLMGDVLSTINGCCTPQAASGTTTH
jgi:hypothetical protein